MFYGKLTVCPEWYQALDKELFHVILYWFSVAAYKYPETVT